MPGFDGTGPQGQGPMSGRGQGHCAIKLCGSGQAPLGYAGIQGAPVSPEYLSAQAGAGTPIADWLQPVRWLGCVFKRGRGRGGGRAGRQQLGRR